MADKGLRSRLAAAAGLAIDEDTLDQIHDKLMMADGAAKIPLNVKYVFTRGQDGSLDVEISAKANMILQGFKLRLTSDGKQLGLFGTATDSVEPDDDEPYEDEDLEDEDEEEEPPPPPKPRPKKKAARKKAARKEPQPVEEDEEPAPPRPSGRPSPAERIAAIRKENENLYRTGAITRAQAVRAGVDVDAVDDAGSTTDEMVDGIEGLTPEELKALES